MQILLGQYLYTNITKSFSFSNILEIRIRLNRKIMLRTLNGIHFLNIVADKTLINSIVSNATRNSLYAFENEIDNGYIGYKDGVRIGIIGKGNISESKVIAYKAVYALCIRIPHQIFGLRKEINQILENFENTLIISPPGCGKTTLCREMARLLTNTFDTLIVDERYELCGEDFTMKMGEQCDVISGIPKSMIYENIIRTMAPQLVVCDELFDNNDIEAISRLNICGIKCLATYHAQDYLQIPKSLADNFTYFIVLNSNPTVGSIQSITRRENV
ncbi:MAG: hypothetical protein GX242_06515 [Clostridiales bacterium]|nr:hypothetical protein [Clostridiales bacterium]